MVQNFNQIHGSSLISAGTRILLHYRIRSQLRVDTVRAGPVPDRAVLWTGRRRSGPDRTEQGHGPVSRDRTGRDEARAGPSGSFGPARVQARARAGAWRRGEGAGGSGARRGDVRQLWKFQREIEEPRRSPERAHRRRIGTTAGGRR